MSKFNVGDKVNIKNLKLTDLAYGMNDEIRRHHENGSIWTVVEEPTSGHPTCIRLETDGGDARGTFHTDDVVPVVETIEVPEDIDVTQEVAVPLVFRDLEIGDKVIIFDFALAEYNNQGTLLDTYGVGETLEVDSTDLLDESVFLVATGTNGTKFKRWAYAKGLSLAPETVVEEPVKVSTGVEGVMVGDTIVVVTPSTAQYDDDEEEAEVVCRMYNEGSVMTVIEVDSDDTVQVEYKDIDGDLEHYWLRFQGIKFAGTVEVAVAELEEELNRDNGIEPDAVEVTINDFDVGALIIITDTNAAGWGCGANLSVFGDRVLTVDQLDLSDNTIYVVDQTNAEWVNIAGVTLVTATVPDTYNYIITGDSITLVCNSGEPLIIGHDHEGFATVLNYVLDKEYAKAVTLMTPAEGIKSWAGADLKVDSGVVTYKDMPLSGKLVDKIINFMSVNNEDYERFAKFLELTLQQQSFKTRERLMDFASCDKVTLNEDGWVVAFKNVRDDFTDKHSGKFDNSVGQSPEMERSQVDDNHDQKCSAGLHVCSPTYLKSFWGTSGRTMKVLIDPRNFVAIPYDYADSKARVCKYTVIEDVTDNIQDYL